MFSHHGLKLEWSHFWSSMTVIMHIRSSGFLCESLFASRRIKKLTAKQQILLREYAFQAPQHRRGRVWGFESWAVLPISSHISLNVKFWVEPAGLQQQWVNVWMCMEVEGWDSREGTSPRTTMLNKQRQFLPHAHGSESELFDFPIHYFSLHAASCW